MTDLDGNVVRLRGSSLSFVLYLDHVELKRMELTEHDRAPEAQEAQEAPEAPEAPHAAQDAAPEPKRRGRPPGSKNKPKQDVPAEPAAPKRKPKPPPLETAPAEAPAPVEAPGHLRL